MTKKVSVKVGSTRTHRYRVFVVTDPNVPVDVRNIQQVSREIYNYDIRDRRRKGKLVQGSIEVDNETRVYQLKFVPGELGTLTLL